MTPGLALLALLLWAALYEVNRWPRRQLGACRVWCCALMIDVELNVLALLPNGHTR